MLLKRVTLLSDLMVIVVALTMSGTRIFNNYSYTYRCVYVVSRFHRSK